MKFYIIIPAHNEADFIGQTLQSLVEQSLLPEKLVVVDDNSTDATAEIARQFAATHSFIQVVQNPSTDQHLPGSKVIQAFYKGLETLDADYDIVCKFDADLIFPKNYLERVADIFKNNPKCGMAGGLPYVEKNGQWVFESIADKSHLRGPIKAYRKTCFDSIGGPKASIGWDTADVLLARYNGWEVRTDERLQVKHLKPTGQNYDAAARFKQGETLYKLRYDFWLAVLSTLKVAIRKRSPHIFMDYMRGYFRAKKTGSERLLNPEEGKFARKVRWKGVRRKLGLG